MPDDRECTIGARRDPTTLLHFGGLIDEVIVCERALTQDEIMRDMVEGVDLAVFSEGKLAAVWGNMWSVVVWIYKTQKEKALEDDEISNP